LWCSLYFVFCFNTDKYRFLLLIHFLHLSQCAVFYYYNWDHCKQDYLHVMDFLNANHLSIISKFFSINFMWLALNFICFKFLNHHLDHQAHLCSRNHHFQVLIGLNDFQMTILVIHKYCFNSIHLPQFYFELNDYDMNHFTHSNYAIFQLWCLSNINIFSLNHFKNNFQLKWSLWINYYFYQFKYFMLQSDIDWTNIFGLAESIINENFCALQFKSDLLNLLRYHLPVWSLILNDLQVTFITLLYVPRDKSQQNWTYSYLLSCYCFSAFC
jgi:hypothetical protein